MKEINSKWSELDSNQKENVREKVGNALTKAILTYVKKKNSPVSGEGSFSPLSKDYAKYKRSLGKGGQPNLKLFNKMLPAIESKGYRDGIEIGVFKKKEVPKADNHNKFSAVSKSTGVPRRQFIPKKNENFKKPINNIIKKIIDDEYGVG